MYVHRVKAGRSRRLTYLLSGATALATTIVSNHAVAQAPTASSNFHIGVPSGHKQRIRVTADWTTPLSLVQAGGDFLSAPDAAVDVNVGPDANLFAITDLSGTSGQPSQSLIVAGPGSTVTNNGWLDSYPDFYPFFDVPNQNQRSYPVIVMSSNSIVNNFGTLGFMPPLSDDNYGGVMAPCTMSGLTCETTKAAVNNYGLIVGDTPVSGGELPAPGMVVKNFAGAKMIAGGGSPVLGATTYNYQNAGLIDLKIDGSYCTHTGSFANAYNWGYCLGIANGYWMDQGRGQKLYDHGGPLVPSSLDMDGNLVFNGTISSTYFEGQDYINNECPTANGYFGPIHIVGEATANLSNTLYTIVDSGKIVNYLPLMYGYPLYSEPWNAIGQHTGPLSSTLNFYFAGLTAAQQALVASAVQAGSNSTAGGFTLDGQNYSWCPFMKVTATFGHTIAGKGINGFPIPGVSFPRGRGKPDYFIDPANLTTNPYYLTNAATVRLTGSVAEPQGQLTIEPGWTVVVGAQLTVPVPGSSMEKTTVYDDTFNESPSSGQSIQIQAAPAHTDANVDGIHGNTQMLSGALVIDNTVEDVTLPSLAGGGSVMQEGAAITTLAGQNNTITGPLYLGNGTLRIAAGSSFATPPALIVGVNDWRQTYPTFDLSALSDGTTFVLSSLSTAGPQIQTGQVGLIYWYPTINLGSATLRLGTGSNTNSSKFIGGLTGAGSLVLSSGTTFELGGVSAFDVNGNPPTPFLISTYSGGTTIDAGATLVLQNLSPLGKGPVQNSGTIELGNGVQYLPVFNGVAPPTSTANPLHLISLPASYQQNSSGNLLLRVNGDDGTGPVGSGAGTAYEAVTAAGPINLSGSLTLKLIEGYAPPAAGATLGVVNAPAGLTGRFSSIKTLDHTLLIEQNVSANGISLTIKPR